MSLKNILTLILPNLTHEELSIILEKGTHQLSKFFKESYFQINVYPSLSSGVFIVFKEQALVMICKVQEEAKR